MIVREEDVEIVKVEDKGGQPKIIEEQSGKRENDIKVKHNIKLNS